MSSKKKDLMVNKEEILKRWGTNDENFLIFQLLNKWGNSSFRFIITQEVFQACFMFQLNQSFTQTAMSNH